MKREEYICLDPVIEQFNKEKPYSKKFDAMPTTLQSLEGLGNMPNHESKAVSIHAIRLHGGNLDQGMGCACVNHPIPSDELGFLKKVFDKLGDTKVGKAFKKVRDTVKEGVGTGVKFLNRYVNPATILLRNGVLLGMKINMLKVAEKLRFAYLSEAELKRRGFSSSSISKLHKAKSTIEKIYKGAGGKNENLRKAIITGKGNKDGKVPFSLAGLGSTDEFSDPIEAIITLQSVEQLEQSLREEIQLEQLNGLGAVATGSALAAASSVLAAVASILKSIQPPPGENMEDWNVEGDFPPGSFEDPDIQAILNNPEGFDPSIAERAAISTNTEALVNSGNSNASNGGASNKKLLLGVGAGILLLGGLVYLNKQKQAPSLAGTSKRKK